jgi:CDP-diacylglycerol--serine O-phosphatidyltransferase
MKNRRHSVLDKFCQAKIIALHLNKIFKLKKHLPNFITCLNLMCGCIAVVQAFAGNLTTSACFVFLGAFFDFADGMAARVLKAYSPIGKELDSMADMVTFGLVPGVLTYKLMELSHPELMATNIFSIYLLRYFPFLITLFSALRLAKFNIDTRQTVSFIGVPTPAVSIFIASLPFILNQFKGRFDSIILNPFVLIALVILMCYLLVSEIHLFSLKFKNLKWQDNKIQFIFLTLIIPLGLFFFYAAIPMVFFLYVILSLLNKKGTKDLNPK